MKASPPRLANWLLRHFGPEPFLEALEGDLREEYCRHRSTWRYWREVCWALFFGAIERVKRGLIPLVQGIAASWAMLILCLWSAKTIEHCWLQRLPGAFGQRVMELVALGHGAQWPSVAQWIGWLLLVWTAHSAAGAMLALVPTRQRSVAVVMLTVSLLDWKLPLIGGFMRHVLDSRPEEGIYSNLAELSVALLGAGVGMWLSFLKDARDR